MVPTICEGLHILLDSFRILPGHFVLAMNRERHIAFQLAPHLVQQLRSTDAYLVFDLDFSSELHLVVRHIAEAQANSHSDFQLVAPSPYTVQGRCNCFRNPVFRTSFRDSVAGHDPGCNKMWSSWQRSKRPPSPRSTQPAQRKCVRK